MTIDVALAQKLELVELLIYQTIDQDVHPMVLRDRLTQLKILCGMIVPALETNINRIGTNRGNETGAYASDDTCQQGDVPALFA